MIPPPLSRDGDVEADIVFHEYCHGLPGARWPIN
jgi:hypothetical protein